MNTDDENMITDGSRISVRVRKPEIFLKFFFNFKTIFSTLKLRRELEIMILTIMDQITNL